MLEIASWTEDGQIVTDAIIGKVKFCYSLVLRSLSLSPLE